MLPLKLVRSLVLGEAINNPLLLTSNHHHQDNIIHDDGNHDTKTANFHHKQRKSTTNKHQKTPLLLFIPTKELVTDTYKLAILARDIGMNFSPNPSLSHIIFSWPSSSPSSPPPPSAFTTLSWSSTSLSSWSLPDGAVPLPFPSLSISSVSHLRCFVALSKGFFKLVFKKSNLNPDDRVGHENSNWDCCSVSLIMRLTGCRMDSMDSFSKALAGQGWTLFMTKYDPSPDSGDRPIWSTNAVYLFRKLDSARVRSRQPNGDNASSSEECRIRELRLPPLDFRNAPLRILQYILLMTDDIFYLS